MLQINPPVKPFPNYKWRWAILTPTESLNEPPIFLGVLRVFNRYQNYAPSSKEVLDGLAIVQSETDSKVDLVRTQERNLIRNSGQYWKALGLLEDDKGKIKVTAFGKMLAEGKINPAEFATTVIRTFELPNKRIVGDTSDWDDSGLKIYPLQLILDILSQLSLKFGKEMGFITTNELIKIIIPLAGEKSQLNVYVEALIQFRDGKLDVSGWPDCAPLANDRRMAREFLLFLSNYGFCEVVHLVRGNENEKYFLTGMTSEEVKELHNLNLDIKDLATIAKQIVETQIPSNVERKKVSREILARPFQNIFRKNILIAFNSTCIVTGVMIESVLEASHIIDVKYNGNDRIENGLCLRSDIHQLFDSSHLKILPNGDLILSESAARKNNYQSLPSNIAIPDFVNREFLDWRFRYT